MKGKKRKLRRYTKGRREETSFLASGNILTYTDGRDGGFQVTPYEWRFKAIHDSYKYCAPENAPSRARPGHPRLLEAELRGKVDGRGWRKERYTFYTPACPLCGYSDYIVGLGFIVRPAPWALSRFFEGRRFTPFHKRDFPRWARSIERERKASRRIGREIGRRTKTRDANLLSIYKHAVSEKFIWSDFWIILFCAHMIYTIAREISLLYTL